MDIMPVVYVVITVVAVGALLGAGLAAAAQKFAVAENPRVFSALEALPGLNCGACGFPGCSGYANAVVTDPDMPTNMCIPGGNKTAETLAIITNKKVERTQKKVSILRCTRDMRTGAPQKYEYHGIKECGAVAALQDGAFTCPFCCVGMGDCARACPAGAIVIRNGRPSIDPVKCTGCGICVKVCPRDVLELGAHPGLVQVYCRNIFPPGVKRTICPSACIGCTLCFKNCPYGAITMENHVAMVNHEVCPPDCPRPCINKCPTAAILARGIGAEERNATLLLKHENLLTDKSEAADEKEERNF